MGFYGSILRYVYTLRLIGPIPYLGGCYRSLDLAFSNIRCNMIWLFLFDVFVTKLYVVYLTGWPFLRESWILFIVHPNTFNWYPPPSALRWFRSDITQWCSKGKVSFNVNHKVRPSSRVMISDFCNIPANYPQELGLWFDKQFRLCQS